MSPPTQQHTSGRTATSSQYSISDDSQENARLERQAEHLSAIMHGKILHAPLNPSHVKRILDVGCGTGAVTNYFGTTFPDAEVVGLDVNPVVKARDYPPNVKFAKGDIMAQGPEEWDALGAGHENPHQLRARDDRLSHPAHFDLIFTRLVLDLLPHGTDLLAKSFALLTPNGYSEHHELDLTWYDASDQPISSDWPWWRLVKSFSAASDLDFLVGSQVQHRMREVGFVDIGVKEYRWPFGGEWEEGGVWMRFGEYVASEMVGVFEATVEKAAAWRGDVSAGEVQRLKGDVRRDLRPEEGKHWKFWVTWGRKPG